MRERSDSRRKRRIAQLGLLVLLPSILTAADAPTGGEPGVRTFVLSNIFLANGGPEDRCAATDVGGLDRFYAMLPPEEQARYAGTDKHQALEMRMNAYFKFRRLFLNGTRAGAVKLPPGLARGATPTPEQALAIGALNGFPAGTGRLAFQNREIVYSACSNPEDFQVLGKDFRTYDGAVAAGVDLDGKPGKEDFIGSDGKRNVDNQLWRAVGCVTPFRESSNPDEARKRPMSARAPTLIELRGVDDPRNDGDVTVNIYATSDPLTRDARGNPLAGASFTIDPDPRLQATSRGRIVDGVLTTDPIDIVVNYKEQIIDAPREIRGARLRAVLKDDGTIEGGIFGYYTLSSYYGSIEQMTQNGANLSRLSCPGVWKAIHRLADGYRDRKTGRFTAISSAYSFMGVRAFAVRAPAEAAAGNGF